MCLKDTIEWELRGCCAFVDKLRVQLNEVIPLWLDIASFQGLQPPACHFLIGKSLSRLGS